MENNFEWLNKNLEGIKKQLEKSNKIQVNSNRIRIIEIERKMLLKKNINHNNIVIKELSEILLEDKQIIEK